MRQTMILDELIDENRYRKYSQKTSTKENTKKLSSYDFCASDTQYGITSPSISNLRQNQLAMTDKKTIREEEKLSVLYENSEYKTPKSNQTQSVIKNFVNPNEGSYNPKYNSRPIFDKSKTRKIFKREADRRMLNSSNKQFNALFKVDQPYANSPPKNQRYLQKRRNIFSNH